jgi:uncharacterized membrane protein
MNTRKASASLAFRISAVAVLAALVAVFTLFVRVPSPAKGYFNLSDAVVVFTGLVFGPFTALIAGGLGTAAADLIAGFAQWAPISLLAHGLQGFAIGLLARRRPGSIPLAIAACTAGVLVMAGIYLAGGSVLAGPAAAVAELPGNLVQAAAGAVLGIPLSAAVRKAYPPVKDWSW